MTIGDMRNCGTISVTLTTPYSDQHRFLSEQVFMTDGPIP